MKPLITFSILLFLSLSAQSQTLSAYKIYNTKGVEVSFNELIIKSLSAEIVFFGELHNNPIAHWLQLEMIKAFRAQTLRHITVGAEMFESDNQLIIDEYLRGIIPEKNFEEEAKLWSNYKTDYKPIVLFAKDNGIPIIATNTPRRYASMVSRGGFEALDSLSDEAKMLIAPLPFPYDPELPGYKAMTKMPTMHLTKISPENLTKAQALKDATMAHFTLKYLKDRGLFVHLNGSYHTQNKEGLYWYIMQQLNNIEMVSISTISVPNVDSVGLDDLQTADYTICVDEDMTNTY
ncbi:MAG: ChaN family lipoprotein [Salinivirgaceae bacterium]|nr:ChaN family lipoprotein [Salinivirgaceae bacterium]